MPARHIPAGAVLLVIQFNAFVYQEGGLENTGFDISLIGESG